MEKILIYPFTNSRSCDILWEDLLEGKALTYCSGSTLHKLERLGYIKILNDTTNTKDLIDMVQLVEN